MDLKKPRSSQSTSAKKDLKNVDLDRFMVEDMKPWLPVQEVSVSCYSRNHWDPFPNGPIPFVF